MSEELRGTKIPYELLALNFDTLMDDYVKLKEKSTIKFDNMRSQRNKLKSTLDEIKKLKCSCGGTNNCTCEFEIKLKKALAKHEGLKQLDSGLADNPKHEDKA